MSGQDKFSFHIRSNHVRLRQDMKGIGQVRQGQVNVKSGKVRTGQFKDRSRHVKVKSSEIRSIRDKVRSGLSMSGQFRLDQIS